MKQRSRRGNRFERTTNSFDMNFGKNNNANAIDVDYGLFELEKIR